MCLVALKSFSIKFFIMMCTTFTEKQNNNSQSSVSYSEHFSYSHGEYGPLHAKPLQQQNLVSALTTHYCSTVCLYSILTVFIRVCLVNHILCLPLSRFVIELCEPIQVKQLDIANFELFSSTPKDFLVSISDRYAHV